LSEEFEERKTTTITRTGLSVELTRTSKGSYKWTIQVDLSSLDEDELLRRLEGIDRALRRRFLKEAEGEKVEERREETIEKPLKTLPLRRRRRLLGRISIFRDKISLEPISPLPVEDSAIGWLRGFVEGRVGKDRIEVEKTVSGERFKRIIIHAKLSDKDLNSLARKAGWSFEKAMEREAGGT